MSVVTINPLYEQFMSYFTIKIKIPYRQVLMDLMNLFHLWMNDDFLFCSQVTGAGWIIITVALSVSLKLGCFTQAPYLKM